MDPTLGRQAVAVGAIVGLTLCRINLGAMAGTLVVVSLGGELLRPRDERSLGAALRRQAPILALLAILVLGAVYFLGPGASRLGAYGNLDLSGVGSRLFGSQSGQARGTAEAYTRSLALGTLLFPLSWASRRRSQVSQEGLADRPVWFRFWRSAHSLRS